MIGRVGIVVHASCARDVQQAVAGHHPAHVGSAVAVIQNAVHHPGDGSAVILKIDRNPVFVIGIVGRGHDILESVFRDGRGFALEAHGTDRAAGKGHLADLSKGSGEGHVSQIAAAIEGVGADAADTLLKNQRGNPVFPFSPRR